MRVLTLAVLLLWAPAWATARGAGPALETCGLEAARSSAGVEEIVWQQFSVAAIRTDATDPVEFRVEFAGTPSSAHIELALGGGNVPLSPVAGNVWSCTLTAAQMLNGYSPIPDANHNFVGFLRVYQGATELLSINLFVNVVDDNVPPVTPIILEEGTAQRSCRVYNQRRPLSYPPSEAEEHALAQDFFAAFGDDFDFINLVYSQPIFLSNRTHEPVQNSVTGIGLAMFDQSAAWGSAGRLLGVTRYPIDTFFDLADEAALHEMGHQWINYSSWPLLAVGSPHWRPGTQARGVMGVSSPFGVGLDFPYDLIPEGGGIYRMEFATYQREYTDLDLYLMGFLPPDSVGSNFVFSDPDQPVCDGCSGPVTFFTVGDVIAAQGARIPDAASSPHAFRVGTIVVTRDRLLDADEMAMFDYWAQRGEATIEVPFSSGFVSGTTKPFYLATRTIGSLETWLDDACGPVAVESAPSPIRASLRLAGPNPVRGETAFEWNQPAAARATLDVFSVSGARIARLADGDFAAGAHRLAWTPGKIGSGVYFATLRLGGKDAGSRRVVVIH
jgi:hypothetical protein